MYENALKTLINQQNIYIEKVDKLKQKLKKPKNHLEKISIQKKILYNQGFIDGMSNFIKVLENIEK